MKIQFEIKERLTDLLDQLLHSKFWITEVEELEKGKKLIKIHDFTYPLEAIAEVTDTEIFLRTAWSKYTYRLYEVDNVCWCEYNGAYRGLLEQKLLPVITPKENLLDQPVTSSLFGDVPKPLREYAIDNAKNRKHREQSGEFVSYQNDHPKMVYDAFIKEDYIPDSH